MKSLEELYQLWDELADIPVNESSELNEAFLTFEKGTPCEDVWHWFEAQSKFFIVAEVQSGIRYVQDSKGALTRQIIWPTANNEASLFNVTDLARGVGMSIEDFAHACKDNDDFLADSTRNADPVDREESNSDDMALMALHSRHPYAVKTLVSVDALVQRPRG